MEEKDIMALDEACANRDALVTKLIKSSKEYRLGMRKREALIRYLAGLPGGDPKGQPTLLRDAQALVLELAGIEWVT